VETAAHMAAYLDFTEKRFRAAIDRLPAGTYVDEDALDGDTPGSTVTIRLALTVGQGRLHFDFSGSGRQLNSARNIPYRALLATIYTVAKSLLDPEVPANAGYYRTITLQAPAGSVVGPEPPAAVGARSISCGVLGDVIAGCLSQAMPDKALARCGPHHLLVLAGTNPRTTAYFVDYETVAGGMGARAQCDGMDAVRVHASGASNLPVEALEHVYPLRIERYALRDDSAGAGRYRGGQGVIRDYRILGADVHVSLSSERQQVAAHGTRGGKPGATGMFVLNPGQPDERQLPSATADVPLPRDSILSIRTPAGGGYGEVEQRDPQLIERDLREARISLAHARRSYQWPHPD
jgi:N-methylhydantoinase B